MNHTTPEKLFQAFQDKESWSGICVAILRRAARHDEHRAEILGGLVGQDGSAIEDISQVRGITIALCEKYCSSDNLEMIFHYQDFFGRTTNYLLPWLALTAQLPYEAGDVVPNIMSFFVALGSPTLLTFSLMITILNKRWLNRKCKEFERKHHGSPFITRLAYARVVLDASQQVPIRLSQDQGWLASLVVLDANANWWARLSARVLATSRGVTLSLVAQMLLAVVAWILTIVSSFRSTAGDEAETLILTSSILWTWIVPVICGWITVRTQNSPDSIESALRADAAVCAPVAGRCTEGIQRALQTAALDSADPANIMGFSIHGDEMQQGPTFNYARVFTWRHASRQLLSCFDEAARLVDGNPGCVDLANQTTRGQTPDDIQHDDAQRTTACRAVTATDLTDYPAAKELDANFGLQIIGASVMALFVQWGSTGPAIIMAYLTDVKGLGCRSGSYLIYGVLSTISFALCFSSVLFSQMAMLRAQSSEYGGWAFRALGWCAVVTRLLGRILITSNACWIIVSSVWELVGFYSNCWCNGVVLSRGYGSWVALFKKDVDLRDATTGSWGGGIFMSLSTTCVSSIMFWVLCRDTVSS